MLPELSVCVCLTRTHALTVVALALVPGQHDGHPQADSGRAAGDQHHFLPGTSHVSTASSALLCAGSVQGQVRASLRGSQRHGGHMGQREISPLRRGKGAGSAGTDETG